jgi:hypothetical protein
MLTQLQEAFDAKVAEKVAEARKEAEVAIREEFAARFAHDKDTFVQAVEKALDDVVTETETRKAAEVKSLREAKARLEKTIAEGKRFYKKKLGEDIESSHAFIERGLASVVKGLSEQKAALAAKERKLDEAYAADKATMVAEHAARLKKVDEFVISSVTRELKEFAQDQRALNEARARLAGEAKAKLAETQKKFVAESAKKVERVVNETLTREMRQLHEDLEANRQNMFGRRIFEAVAAEFMTSYLAEGTEMRKLQKVVEAKEAELNTVKTKLDETVQASQNFARKVKLAEDRAAREKIMAELLSPLRGEKRAVMESMLETIKTDALKTQFDRLLPVVLAEGRRKPAAPARLTETRAPAPSRGSVVTGDKPNRLAEAVNAEIEGDAEINAEIASIAKLAGIRS